MYTYTNVVDLFDALYTTDIVLSDLTYDTKLRVHPNDKVVAAFKKLGYKNSEIACLSFPAIVTCFGRSSCSKACYAFRNERMHYNSAQKCAVNNAALVLSCKNLSEMLDLVNRSFTGKRVIRLNSNGDFPSYLFMKAIVLFAKQNLDVLIYGYSKQFVWLKRLISEFDILPDNLIISLSLGYNVPIGLQVENSPFWHNNDYAKIIEGLQEHFQSCYVVFGENEYPNLPWNNQEQYASTKQGDFRILFHNGKRSHYGKLAEKIYQETTILAC